MGRKSLFEMKPIFALLAFGLALAATTPGQAQIAAPTGGPAAGAASDDPAAEAAPPEASEESEARPLEPPAAAEQADAENAEADGPDRNKTMCGLIEDSAQAHALPVEYFARLIWKESSFDPSAVSRVGAQGVAQFMPYTADERGLEDPFDPIQAIPASASFLRDLRLRFGNLGLAAAAYNAGPQRVANWLSGLGELPFETQDYVAAITGRVAEDWAALANGDNLPDLSFKLTCVQVVAAVARPGIGDRPVVARVTAPWGVQVAGNFSESVAMRSFARLRDRHSGIIGSRQPVVVRERLRGRGPKPVYQVRIGADTRNEADDLCTRLKSVGASCIVMKN